MVNERKRKGIVYNTTDEMVEARRLQSQKEQSPLEFACGLVEEVPIVRK